MSRIQRLVSFASIGALISGLLVVGLEGSPVAAAPAPVAQRTATMPSATQLPTVQIDGVAWSQEVIGNNVYVAGQFSNARPAGAAPGTSLTPRNNMLSYDITTGALNTTFAPNLNSQAYVVAASPDGSRVYVGGQFTQANGVTRNRLAAYSTATGALITTFVPNLNSSVRGIAVTNDAVYVGGAFSTANGVARNRLAAFNPTNGALLAWNPSADAVVQDLVMTPDNTKVIAGGHFTTVGGMTRNGLAAISATTGVPQTWAINNTIYNHGSDAAILSLDADDNAVYGTGYVFGNVNDGNLEGSFSANPTTGAVNWIQNCHGDHYDAWSSGSVVYHSSHAHYCTPVGGYFQSDPWSTNMRFATAFSTQATGTNGRDEYAGGTYFNFEGTASPTMYNWFPDFTTGNASGANQATWSVKGNGQYVVYAGEFPRVNNVLQQGLVRFKVPTNGELTNPPRISGANFVPSVVGTGVGKIRVAWRANWDRDDLTLTYRLVRNGLTASPIYVTTADSTFWNRPNLGYIDSGLTPGATYRYRLYVLDASGNTVAGDTVTIVAPSTATTSAYDERVIADGAAPYWTLGESSGSVAIDSVGFDDGVVGTGVTRGVPGSTIGFSGTASRFDGTTNGVVTSATAVPGPNTFAVSAWFKTTTTSGGKIIGFGNANNGASGNYDRHVYMSNDGRIWFGVYPGGVRTLNTSASYNDGQWHQVVASLGSDGMRLSIDGRQVAARSDVTFGQGYTGYWRVGGDNLDGWTASPASRYFAGDIGNVAFFPNTLTRTQIRDQFIASGRTLGTAVPSDSYGAAVYNDDPDLYWRLGDGSGSTTAADSGSYGVIGSVTNGVTFGQPGAVLGTPNTAADFNGIGGLVNSQTPVDNPTVYTEEAWFKTTTTTGGKIIGFSNSNSATNNPADNLSTGYDRHVFMQDDGKLVFGTYTGQLNTATSVLNYNDGQWHYVAASQGPDGMKLYVDGTLVASNPQTGAQNYIGYWRIGGDNTWNSTSQYFDGQIDEAAVYSKVLTASQVAQRYTLGSGQTPNIAPNAAFTSNANGLTVSFDGSTSSDPDGSVTTYAWNFGDGSSAAASSSATTSHSYTAGGTYAVTLTITDNGNITNSTTKSVTVLDAYGAAVAADAPYLFWRLGESSGTTALDSSGNNRNGAYQNGVGLGAAGPLAGSTATAASFDGNDDFVVGNQEIPGPKVYSEEAWFKTTTTSGGKIMGFGCSATGVSGCYDRHIYMSNDGLVTFGVWTGFTNTITSPTPLNDGLWHQVVATQDGSGLKLYVDGGLVGTNPQTDAQDYNGYWRVGGDNHWGCCSPFFAGTIGIASVYSTALSASRVAAHYQAATNGPPANQPPTANFTQTPAAALRTIDFNSTSTDSDGTIASTTWNFGDGGSSTVSNPSHTYAADGNYTVTLTVTDNSGGTNSTQQTVSIVTPNQPPVASFTASPTNLVVAFNSTSTDNDGVIASTTWDFGDGGTSTEASPTHTYSAANTYAVTLTVTDDDGDSNTATQNVTVSSANVGPHAEFTATSTNLTVNVDASLSTDSDGTISGYSWAFGDGGTGTGVTASHNYAVAGDYTVTLTVTDDDNTTATATKTVTVTAPVGPVVVATDTFSRTLATGLGAADLGGNWTLSSGATNYSVSAGTGKIRMATAGAGPQAFLNAVSAHDVNVVIDVSLDKVATGGGTYVSLAARRSGTSDYRARIKYLATGAVALQVGRVVNGTETYLQTVNIAGITVVAGDVLRLRFEVTGTDTATLKAKVWRVGTTEPALPQNTVNDSTPSLNVSGGVGIQAYLSGSATNSPVVASFDNLSAERSN